MPRLGSLAPNPNPPDSRGPIGVLDFLAGTLLTAPGYLLVMLGMVLIGNVAEAGEMFRWRSYVWGGVLKVLMALVPRVTWRDK